MSHITSPSRLIRNSSMVYVGVSDSLSVYRDTTKSKAVSKMKTQKLIYTAEEQESNP